MKVPSSSTSLGALRAFSIYMVDKGLDSKSKKQRGEQVPLLHPGRTFTHVVQHTSGQCSLFLSFPFPPPLRSPTSNGASQLEFLDRV